MPSQKRVESRSHAVLLTLRMVTEAISEQINFPRKLEVNAMVIFQTSQKHLLRTCEGLSSVKLSHLSKLNGLNS